MGVRVEFLRQRCGPGDHAIDLQRDRQSVEWRIALNETGEELALMDRAGKV